MSATTLQRPLRIAVRVLIGAGIVFVAALRPRDRRAASGVRRQLAHDELRLGGRRLAELHPHAPQRAHRGRAPLHRRERLLADLRPHARRQHGARLVLPPRRLHRVRGAAEDDRAGVLARRQRGEHAGSGSCRPSSRVAARRRGRPRRAAGLPALEPGPGAASGTDHDRHLGDPRRPGDRALQRRDRRQPHLARVDRASRRAPAPRDRVLGRTARRALPRPCRGRVPLGLAPPHAHRHGDPRRRRRPADDLGARPQHPAHVRHRVHRRLGARRPSAASSARPRGRSPPVRTDSGSSTRSSW